MKNPHAVALGRKGGQARSLAKARASRENGKKGGWPKGKKRRPKKIDFSILPPADALHALVKALNRV